MIGKKRGAVYSCIFLPNILATLLLLLKLNPLYDDYIFLIYDVDSSKFAKKKKKSLHRIQNKK